MQNQQYKPNERFINKNKVKKKKQKGFEFYDLNFQVYWESIKILLQLPTKQQNRKRAWHLVIETKSNTQKC